MTQPLQIVMSFMSYGWLLNDGKIKPEDFS
ncbi:hypothetical protein N836_23605 [Leptolyngbya sp. Heron Island J]|nr:hypothetical protein N836_23605 [Leptolyngbya sp. Heron Island J]